MPINDFIMKCNDFMVPLAESDDCRVYQIKNETGDGTMTVYDVFPGVLLAYNDYHMENFFSKLNTNEDLLCIDHCQTGRFEYSADETAFSYVEAGDLKFDRRLKHTGNFHFPFSHYHGITISIQLPIAKKSLPEEFRGFTVDLYSLQQKFCADGNPMVLHAPPSIVHIFDELYVVPEKIKRSYFKIKVLELLLYMETLELPKSQAKRPYFYKTQVEKIKSMHTFMIENLEHRYTMDELSAKFDIPLTPMKNCFKSVYGSPISTYMRVFRMNRAAVLLKKEKNIGVAEIGGIVGYDSPSKFTAAFRNVIGKTPMDYRKH